LDRSGHGFSVVLETSSMNILRKLLGHQATDATGSLGLLVLRAIMGAAFLCHGWPKIQNPFGWMGPEAAVPSTFQLLAAVAEFGGGMALVVGLVTRLAALGIACTMIAALALVHLPKGDPFVAMPPHPSFEPAAVYLACAILFLTAGAGRFSLDALLFGGSPAAHARGASQPGPARVG
jgi:putative oxidoreductase